MHVIVVDNSPYRGSNKSVAHVTSAACSIAVATGSCSPLRARSSHGEQSESSQIMFRRAVVPIACSARPCSMFDGVASDSESHEQSGREQRDSDAVLV
ncbi:hypothetical protein RRG08_056880 [Elysia crispata]|uniref:Uncharacterized protein n=1 Tax=Elysia crispata TaxID=231223 RepID=A0AAE0ZE92_9GAST|nr:hypothetical protein RRG08_056880 [Elysia crispata]